VSEGKKNELPVSLFVVHWNQPLECIATVNAFQQQHVDLKTIVVDNDSKPEAFQTLTAQIDPAIEIMRLSENKGWGGALNIVLRKWLQEEKNPFCLISAHDAGPRPDCLRLLMEAAQADPRIGIACPQYPERFIAHSRRYEGPLLGFFHDPNLSS
jgi:GT2 family glycosyltransferase